MVKFVIATFLPDGESEIGKRSKEIIQNSFSDVEQQVVVLNLENMSEEILNKFIDMGAIDCFCFTSDTLPNAKTKNILSRVLSVNERQKKNIKFINVFNGKEQLSIDDASRAGKVLLTEGCNATISHFDVNSDENIFIQNLQGIRNSAVRERNMLLEKEKFIMDFTSKIVSDIETGKDEYTGRHIRSVCVIAEAIARKLDIEDKEIDVLKVGALLHDIGKQDVSDSVLKKPSRLTNDEFNEMKAHVLMGEVELNQYDLGEFERAKRIVSEHHEKFDGTGYPRGLKGTEIDELSRIVSLADATQAMFGRSYQSGRTKDELIAEINRCAGTQFDPTMVEALCDVLETSPQSIYVEYDSEGKIIYNVPTTEQLIAKAESGREERKRTYFSKIEEI